VIVAPGRDGDLTCKVLTDAGHACQRCGDGLDLAMRLGDDAGALVIA